MPTYRFLVFVSLVEFSAAAWNDSGFMHWFDDELQEVTGAPLEFAGDIPDYLRGTFVRESCRLNTLFRPLAMVRVVIVRTSPELESCCCAQKLGLDALASAALGLPT